MKIVHYLSFHKFIYQANDIICSSVVSFDGEGIADGVRLLTYSRMELNSYSLSPDEGGWNMRVQQSHLQQRQLSEIIDNPRINCIESVEAILIRISPHKSANTAHGSAQFGLAQLL